MRYRDLSLERKILTLITAGFAMLLLFLGLYFQYSEEEHHEVLLLKQTRLLFEQIQTARFWNAEHGGVYAFLKEGEQANQYLYNVGPGDGLDSGVEPEIRDEKGRRLGLINPALMTRELSVLTGKMTNTRFHLTSLQLINPDNAPDEFERSALKAFEDEGKPEATAYTEINGKPYFRYMAPLEIKQECLQ